MDEQDYIHNIEHNGLQNQICAQKIDCKFVFFFTMQEASNTNTK